MTRKNFKLVSIVLLAIILFIASQFSHAANTRWEIISITKDAITYKDTTSYKDENTYGITYRTMWVKRNFITESKMNGKSVKTAMFKVSSKCDNRYANLYGVIYFKDGTSDSARLTPIQEEIVPDTLGETIYNEICSEKYYQQ